MNSYDAFTEITIEESREKLSRYKYLRSCQERVVKQLFDQYEFNVNQALLNIKNMGIKNTRDEIDKLTHYLFKDITYAIYNIHKIIN